MLIEIPAAAGPAEALVARPSTGAGPFPGVILYMDAFGLRPRIEDMAQRIADWGYVVLAPNVFYRDGTAAELAPDTDMTTPEGRAAAGKAAFPRVGHLTTDKALPDIDAWVKALAALDGVAPGPIGTFGYCMGARLAVRTATSHPEVVAACGGFHGGGLATDGADSPHLGLGNARRGSFSATPTMTRAWIPTPSRAWARRWTLPGLRLPTRSMPAHRTATRWRTPPCSMPRPPSGTSPSSAPSSTGR